MGTYKLTVTFKAPSQPVEESIEITGSSFSCIPDTNTGTLSINYTVVMGSGNYGLQILNEQSEWNTVNTWQAATSGNLVREINTSPQSVGNFTARIIDTSNPDVVSNEKLLTIQECSGGGSITFNSAGQSCNGVNMDFSLNLNIQGGSGEFILQYFNGASWSNIQDFQTEDGNIVINVSAGNIVNQQGSIFYQLRVIDNELPLTSNTLSVELHACPVTSLTLNSIDSGSNINLSASSVYGVGGKILLQENNNDVWTTVGLWALPTEPYSSGVYTSFDYVCIDDKQYRLACYDVNGFYVYSNSIVFEVPTTVVINNIIPTGNMDDGEYSVTLVNANVYSNGDLEIERYDNDLIDWVHEATQPMPSNPYTGDMTFTKGMIDNAYYRIIVKDDIGGLIYSNEFHYSNSRVSITGMTNGSNQVGIDVFNINGFFNIDHYEAILQVSDNGVSNWTEAGIYEFPDPNHTFAGYASINNLLSPTDGKYYRIWCRNSLNINLYSEAFLFVEPSSIILNSITFKQIPSNETEIGFTAVKVTEVQNAEGTRRLALQKSSDGLTNWTNVQDWLGNYAIEFPDSPVPFSGSYADWIGFQAEEGMFYRICAGDYSYNSFYSEALKYNAVRSVTVNTGLVNSYCDGSDLNVQIVEGTVDGDSFYSNFELQIWNGIEFVNFQSDGFDITFQAEDGVIYSVEFILDISLCDTTQTFRLKSMTGDTSIVSNQFDITFPSPCP